MTTPKVKINKCKELPNLLVAVENKFNWVSGAGPSHLKFSLLCVWCCSDVVIGVGCLFFHGVCMISNMNVFVFFDCFDVCRFVHVVLCVWYLHAINFNLNLFIVSIFFVLNLLIWLCHLFQASNFEAFG